MTIQSAQPIALKILLNSCHRGHDCQVIVVVACLCIRVHGGVGHGMEDHLTDLQPWVQWQRMMQTLVLQLKRELASVPAWVAPASK